MQQDLKRKLIAKSFHRFAQDALTTAKITFGPSPSAEFQTKKVPKYAPRYIKELPVDNLKDAKLVKALKRVKVIESVSDESASENIGNRWRIALQNKLKTVMKYKPDKFEWKSIEKYKAFSKITNVILHDEARKKGSKRSKKRSTSFSWNLLKWIPGMVNLRCLNFHMKNAYPGTLKRLNSVIPNSTFSLKAVRISLETSQNAFLSFIGGDGNISHLSSLIENKNILERLTHLDLNNIRGKDFLSNFELISKNCKNIVSLSMGFSDKNEMKSLKLLKDFEKLEYVRLCLEDLLVLLENSALPPSVKDIEISCFNSEDPNNYEEVRSQSLLDFGEKWKHLTNLTSLKMLAGHNPEAAGFIQSFVIMILTNVPSLVSFQFELIDAFKGFDNDNDENNDMGMQYFDVNNIFKALQGVSNQIKEIKISYPQSYTLTCSTEENLDLSFPKLKLLQLPANTIENVETISNIFCALRKPSLAEDNVAIQLDAFVVNSESTLVNLIETLRRSPRNSTTEMTIRIEIFEFNMLEEFIKKAKEGPIIQNVGLTVKIPWELYEITKALSFLEEIFAYVSFESDLEEIFFL